MKATVLYRTSYGSTRRYADALAHRLGTTAHPLADVPVDHLRDDPSAPLVVLSPVHGPRIAAASFVAHHDLGPRPVAVCAVGMTLPDEARERDRMAGILAAKPEVARFYLPGRLDYSTLGRRHRLIMWGLIAVLRIRPGASRSENEQAMIEAYGRDTDRLDLTELEPVVAWARRCVVPD